MTLRSGRYTILDGTPKIELIFDLQGYHMKLVIADRAIASFFVTNDKLEYIKSYLHDPYRLMKFLTETYRLHVSPIKPVLLLMVYTGDVIDEVFDTVEEAKEFVNHDIRWSRGEQERPIAFYILPFDIRFYFGEYKYPEEYRYIPENMKTDPEDIYLNDAVYVKANSHFLKGKELLQRRSDKSFAQEALDEFETAADMGHVRAMYYAGIINDNPRLNAKCTRAKSYEWLMKSAKLGDYDAAKILYDNYSRGMYEFIDELTFSKILRTLTKCGFIGVKKDVQIRLGYGSNGLYLIDKPVRTLSASRA